MEHAIEKIYELKSAGYVGRGGPNTTHYFPISLSPEMLKTMGKDGKFAKRVNGYPGITFLFYENINDGTDFTTISPDEFIDMGRPIKFKRVVTNSPLETL